MKQRHILINLVVWSSFFQIGCQKQARGPQDLDPVASATVETTSAEAIEPGEQAPKITFESVVYDFGTIGPGLKNVAQFKFKNTGGESTELE